MIDARLIVSSPTNTPQEEFLGSCWKFTKPSKFSLVRIVSTSEGLPCHGVRDDNLCDSVFAFKHLLEGLVRVPLTTPKFVCKEAWDGLDLGTEGPTPIYIGRRISPRPLKSAPKIGGFYLGTSGSWHYDEVVDIFEMQGLTCVEHRIQYGHTNLDGHKKPYYKHTKEIIEHFQYNHIENDEVTYWKLGEEYLLRDGKQIAGTLVSKNGKEVVMHNGVHFLIGEFLGATKVRRRDPLDVILSDDDD